MITIMALLLGGFGFGLVYPEDKVSKANVSFKQFVKGGK